jgi:hypothetical protein
MLQEHYDSLNRLTCLNSKGGSDGERISSLARRIRASTTMSGARFPENPFTANMFGFFLNGLSSATAGWGSGGAAAGGAGDEELGGRAGGDGEEDDGGDEEKEAARRRLEEEDEPVELSSPTKRKPRASSAADRCLTANEELMTSIPADGASGAGGHADAAKGGGKVSRPPSLRASLFGIVGGGFGGGGGASSSSTPSTISESVAASKASAGGHGAGIAYALNSSAGGGAGAGAGDDDENTSGGTTSHNNSMYDIAACRRPSLATSAVHSLAAIPYNIEALFHAKHGAVARGGGAAAGATTSSIATIDTPELHNAASSSLGAQTTGLTSPSVVSASDAGVGAGVGAGGSST